MILFFYGPNSFAARQKIKQLVKRFKAKSDNDFGLERIDGSDPEIKSEQVIGALTNLPLLGGQKLVIIDGLLENKPVAEKVIEHLERIPKEAVVVFLEREPDERTKAFKALKKQARTHKFEHLQGAQLTNWLRKSAQELKASLDQPTAGYLVEQVGANQWQLFNELQKLANFSPEISREAVDKLVEPSFQNTIFDLVEAIGYGQVDKAIKIYEGLRANKAEPIYVLTMIGWQLRNLVIAKAAEGKNPGQVAKDFGMNPFVVRKSLALAKGLDMKHLKRAHQNVLATDWRLKTTSTDPDMLLEQLIISTAKILK